MLLMENAQRKTLFRHHKKNNLKINYILLI